MKDFGTPALDAITAGEAMSVGAVKIDCQPDPVRIWGGYGDLTIASETYLGVGDRGLVSAVASAMGDAAQNITLALSGVDPDQLALLDVASARRAPVVCYRLVFDAAGATLLAAPVFARGRLDQAPKVEVAGGEATIQALVETAARGLGRGGGRMRALADQALTDATDDGMKSISFAGQVTIYWGGKLPQTAQQAFGGQPGVAAAQQALDNLQIF